MKSFKINFDALVVLVILFCVSVGANIFLLSKYREAADLSVKQGLTIMVNDLNLSSQKSYIKKLQDECGLEPGEKLKNNNNPETK
jgi:hypothetical protein